MEESGEGRSLAGKIAAIGPILTNLHSGNCSFGCNCNRSHNNGPPLSVASGGQAQEEMG